jgi:hypothetical protein
MTAVVAPPFCPSNHPEAAIFVTSLTETLSYVAVALAEPVEARRYIVVALATK